MTTQDTAFNLELSRRKLLAAAGIAGGAAVAASLIGTDAALAAPAAAPSSDQLTPPPVTGLHPQFGADASSKMVVSWHTLQSVRNPRVILGTLNGQLDRVVAAKETSLQKSARCGPTLLVFTGHRTRALRRSSARSGRPRGGARFTFTSFGDQATPTLGKKYQPPEGVTIAKPPYVNDGLGSPAAAGTVLGVERVQPLFHLLNGDLCYANVAEDRVGTWWDFWENNSRSARKRPCWGGRPPTASSVPGCECLQSQPREAVHMTIIRIGLDTSKHVFQIHGVDENEHVVLRRQIRRSEVAKFFAKLAPTRIGIEACGASHYWARVLRGLGHEMVLLPPQYIKPYVKRSKNDKIDAEAICEAMSRPTMRFVPVKSAERQAALTMLGVRDLLVKQRTMLINAIRGHAAEFGLTVAKGPKQVNELLQRLANEEGVPALAREMFGMLASQLDGLDVKLKTIEKQLMAWHRQDQTSQCLATIPGIGPIAGVSFALKVADPQAFHSARHAQDRK